MKELPDSKYPPVDQLIFQVGWEFKTAIVAVLLWLMRTAFIHSVEKVVNKAMTEHKQELKKIEKYLKDAIHGKNDEIAQRDGVINLSNEAMREALHNIEKINEVLKK